MDYKKAGVDIEAGYKSVELSQEKVMLLYTGSFPVFLLLTEKFCVL